MRVDIKTHTRPRFMLNCKNILGILLCVSLATGCTKNQTTHENPEITTSSLINTSEFIYEEAPFPSAHASTIVETPDGIASAWFGGTEEKDPDVGIWFSKKVGESWTTPVEVANGVQSETLRYPTWNPVLFQAPAGPLVLFYKAGPSPQEWWGLVRVSSDNGDTWSDEYRLPEGILGPIRAKPLLMADGSLLAGSSTEHDGWIVHMERLLKPAGDQDMWDPAYLTDMDSWEKVGPLNSANEFEAIQPTILTHSETRLQILCRSRQDVISEAWSDDGGKTWGPMKASSLPNPSAGIDAITLKDGRFLLVYNPTTNGRHQLGLSTSTDGITWSPVTYLENSSGEFSYPAMIQSSNGMVHVSYTWQRERVKHVVIDPANLM